MGRQDHDHPVSQKLRLLLHNSDLGDLLGQLIHELDAQVPMFHFTPAKHDADADFVLEGYVEPGERRTEGPFGDHTGYYSLSDEYPVFHVTCITRRKNPVYITTIVGKPPMEDGYLGKATERLFLPLMQKVLPEIVDINLLTILSISSLDN